MTVIVRVNGGRDVWGDKVELISFVGFAEGVGVVVGCFSLGEVSAVDGTCFPH